MKLSLGAEPKKVAILIVLVVAALAGLYFNSSSDSTPSPAPRSTVVTNPVPVVPAATRAPATRARGGAQGNGEFVLRVPGSRPDDKPLELTSIDPELKLDLLAKVQAVPPIEAGRNLFQFGAAPAPPAPLKPIPTGVPVIPTKTQPPPPPPVQATNPQPVQPQAPPINFKYYGYKVSKTDGHKEAFLLDGEDIIVAQENQMVKQHYKIVRIALNAITIEDTQSNSTQTLNLQDLPS